jgi:hypothetical protein
VCLAFAVRPGEEPQIRNRVLIGPGGRDGKPRR